MTIAEQLLQRGIQQGKQEGSYRFLMQMLELKFGARPRGLFNTDSNCQSGTIIGLGPALIEWRLYAARRFLPLKIIL